MKSFAVYISEASDQKLISSLEAQKQRMEQHASTRFNRNSKRFYDLVDKYEKLKDKAEDADVWDDYCKKHKLSTKHDGYDFYA